MKLCESSMKPKIQVTKLVKLLHQVKNFVAKLVLSVNLCEALQVNKALPRPRNVFFGHKVMSYHELLYHFGASN